jgi:WD40 repeat protein
VWGTCMSVLEGHTSYCTSVAFSPDGGRLVSGTRDSTVRIWNVQTGALLQVMMGHHFHVNCVAYSPDGILIASGSSDRTVILWDAASGVQVGTYAGYTNSVGHVAFSADGLHIASEDGWRVYVWSMDAARRSRKAFNAPGSVILFAFMSRNRLLIASTSIFRGLCLTIWDLESSSCVERRELVGSSLPWHLMRSLQCLWPKESLLFWTHKHG